MQKNELTISLQDDYVSYSNDLEATGVSIASLSTRLDKHICTYRAEYEEEHCHTVKQYWLS